MMTKKLCLLMFGISILFSTNGQQKENSKRNSHSRNAGTGSTVMHGKLITEQLSSVILQENRIGLDVNRKIKIFLPPNYETSGKSYPVVYYCHNFFWNNERMFEDGNVTKLIERGFSNGVVREFIFVVADYSTPTTGSLYENSPVSGRWLDYTVKEVVPFIDGKFRTIRHRDSRALAGDFMGGRGAFRLAMDHADLFSVLYALHPVATGIGNLPWAYVEVDWKKMHQATTLKELEGTGRTQIFLTVSQAFVPNLNRPPFYCDFFVEMENGQPKLNPKTTEKAKAGFILGETLAASADNLRTMRGIAFDWGRFDVTQAHVESNREFSRKLEDWGIEHESEEYRGNPWNRTWTDDGRFYSRVLPFFNRHLVFENPTKIN